MELIFNKINLIYFESQFYWLLGQWNDHKGKLRRLIYGFISSNCRIKLKINNALQAVVTTVFSGK